MYWFIMADEDDEIDILGDSDYSLDNLLSKDNGRLGSCYVSGVLGRQGTEILNCDYNIGPHWLLDTSNQPCWYSAGDDTKSFERNQFVISSSVTSDSLPSTSQWEDSDNWSAKEKSLLEQGLEIFGHSWTQLAQLIGTKTSQQVKNYVTTQNIHLSPSTENFPLEPSGHCSTEVFNFSELIDDMQIPASMEEVIAVVSTAQPTVSSLSKRNNCPSSSLSRESNYKCERAKKKGIRDNKLKNRRGRPPIVKHGDKREMKMKILPTKKNKVEQIIPSVITLPIEEEIVLIRKESYDSDDAEIEVDDDTPKKLDFPKNREDESNDELQKSFCHDPEIKLEKLEESACQEMKDFNIMHSSHRSSEEFNPASSFVDSLRTAVSHQEVFEMIFSMPPPKEELFLDAEVISEEERSIHSEFFEGRSTKTPKRYLKIRNHILECWRQSRPVYVTKTSVRSGLKHCGDVNCIGRIHAYLEQIGAINFGCVQARYLNTTPQSAPLVSTPKKIIKDDLAAVQQARIGAMRPRKKKNPAFILDGDGGYTITHSEDGEAIHTTVVQDTISKGSKGQSQKNKTINLISCHKYSEKKPAPFMVQTSVEALLVIDLHAHSAHTEVAGLLGGTFDSSKKLLHIKRALPCRSNSSGVHCDMCPVSQTEASEKLQGDGLEVVGWYHSHPTFLPNPSLQDLSTQSSIQQWFSQASGLPIVSIILAPYCPTNPTLASQYRCFTVHTDEIDTSPGGTPYMFSVTVTSHGLDIANMLKDMAAIFSLVEENKLVAVDFNSDFQMTPTISYKQKCVESAKLHLASCKPSIPFSLQNSVIQGIMQACGTLDLARRDFHHTPDN